jgi:hypothetical protein
MLDIGRIKTMLSPLPPLVCSLCGKQWDRVASPVVPPCNHTSTDWENHFATTGDDRRQWFPVDVDPEELRARFAEQMAQYQPKEEKS